MMNLHRRLRLFTINSGVSQEFTQRHLKESGRKRERSRQNRVFGLSCCLSGSTEQGSSPKGGRSGAGHFSAGRKWAVQGVPRQEARLIAVTPVLSAPRASATPIRPPLLHLGILRCYGTFPVFIPASISSSCTVAPDGSRRLHPPPCCDSQTIRHSSWSLKEKCETRFYVISVAGRSGDGIISIGRWHQIAL